MPARPHVVAHADWSAHPAKRWVAVAVRGGGGWSLRSLRRAGVAGPIARRLGVDADMAPLLLGVDFAIGVPAGWARAVGVTDFPALLRAAVAGAPPWERFLDPARTGHEIGPHRPFFPGGVARPGDAARLVAALGARDTDGLRRRCERAGAVAAQPLFLTMGQRQVGKGSIAGWRELLVPAALGGADERAPGLWPFDGTLTECVASHAVTVAECYPARASAAIAPGMGGKRDPAARAGAAAAVLAAADRVGLTVPATIGGPLRAGLPAGSLEGLAGDPAGEDPFDALVGLIDMLRVLAEGPEPLPAGAEVRRIEGWILGTPAEAPAHGAGAPVTMPRRARSSAVRAGDS